MSQLSKGPAPPSSSKIEIRENSYKSKMRSSKQQKEAKQPPLTRKDVNATTVFGAREGSQVMAAKSKKVLQHRHVIADAANYNYVEDDCMGGTRGAANDTSNGDDYEGNKVVKKKKSTTIKVSDDMLSVMDLDNWGRKKIKEYAKDDGDF